MGHLVPLAAVELAPGLLLRHPALLLEGSHAVWAAQGMQGHARLQESRAVVALLVQWADMRACGMMRHIELGGVRCLVKP